jgi:hypothetical protein
MKYETVIHIINEGCDRFDAGERAGEIIDGSNITDDITLYCEPTRLYRSDAQSNAGSYVERYLVEA